jgi:hypothetical protein
MAKRPMNPDDIRPALEVMTARAHRQAADVRAVSKTVERVKQRGDRAVIVLRGAPEYRRPHPPRA